jgi:hypothetical protein
MRIDKFFCYRAISLCLVPTEKERKEGKVRAAKPVAEANATGLGAASISEFAFQPMDWFDAADISELAMLKFDSVRAVLCASNTSHTGQATS